MDDQYEWMLNSILNGNWLKIRKKQWNDTRNKQIRSQACSLYSGESFSIPSALLEVVSVTLLFSLTHTVFTTLAEASWVNFSLFFLSIAPKIIAMADTEATGNVVATATATQSSPAKKEKKVKKTPTKPSHPKTSEMVLAAIKGLKERGGSSLQAIKKYIAANYKVESEKIAPFIKKYLKSAVDTGVLVQTKGKGASGSFKLSAAGDKKKKATSAAGKASKKSSPKKQKTAAASASDKTKTAKKSATTAAAASKAKKTAGLAAAEKKAVAAGKPKKAAAEKKTTATKAAAKPKSPAKAKKAGPTKKPKAPKPKTAKSPAAKAKKAAASPKKGKK